MKTYDKLILMDESRLRNEAMEEAFKRDHDRRVIKALEEGQAKAASVHRTIEIYAGSILESLDVLAAFHDEKRGELVELLVSTMWAMQQIREQED